MFQKSVPIHVKKSVKTVSQNKLPARHLLTVVLGKIGRDIFLQYDVTKKKSGRKGKSRTWSFFSLKLL